MRLDRRTSWWIIVITTDRHGLRRPILVQFLLLLSSLPSTAGMTDRHRHNGPSRVSVPKHLNFWNLGTETTSLIFMTKQQDGPSWLRRSVTHSVIAEISNWLIVKFLNFVLMEQICLLEEFIFKQLTLFALVCVHHGYCITPNILYCFLWSLNPNAIIHCCWTHLEF